MRRFIYEKSATNIRDWSLADSFIYIVITSGGKTHNPPGGYPAADERLFSHPSDIRVDGGWVLPSAELARIMIHSVY